MRIRAGELTDSVAITQLLIELGWFQDFNPEQAEQRRAEVERNIRNSLGRGDWR